MRASNYQPKIQENVQHDKLNENYIHRLSEISPKSNNIESSNKQNMFIFPENETFLRNKRQRNAEKFDINNLILQRTINVNFYFNYYLFSGIYQ